MKPTYEELREICCKRMLELEDAKIERGFYCEEARKLRRENASLKDHAEFAARENKKAVASLIWKIFPDFWRKSFCYSKDSPHIPNVVTDWEDGMMGIVVEGFGTSEIRCYMQDKTYRNIRTDKKDWLMIYE